MAGTGAKPGERRGGRKKGVPNIATRDIKALCQQHGPEVIRLLYGWLKNKRVPVQVRMVAGKELLDRGYGRPAQSFGVAGANGGPVSPRRVIIELTDATNSGS